MWLISFLHSTELSTGDPPRPFSQTTCNTTTDHWLKNPCFRELLQGNVKGHSTHNVESTSTRVTTCSSLQGGTRGMFLRDKGGRRQPPDRLPMYLISLCTLYLLYAHYIYIIIYYYILCATYFMLLSITVAEWC